MVRWEAGLSVAARSSLSDNNRGATMDAVEIQPDSAGVVVVVAPGAAWASSAGDVVHSGVPSEESTLGPAGA